MTVFRISQPRPTHTTVVLILAFLSMDPICVSADDRPEPEVHVVGVYEGKYPAGVQHSGNFHPRGAVTVEIKDAKVPIVLVVTSYEPVLWRIVDPKNVVVSVIASGYHKQEVVGLAKDVPIKLISHDAGDEGYFFGFRKEASKNEDKFEQANTKANYEKLVQQVKSLTKKDVSGFMGQYSGGSFIVP